MKKSIFLIALISLVFAACSEDSKSKKGCENGLERCSSDGKLQQCADKVWYDKEDCIAEGGSCIENENGAKCVYGDDDVSEDDVLADDDLLEDTDTSDADETTDNEKDDSLISDDDVLADADLLEDTDTSDADEITDNENEQNSDTDIQDLCKEVVCDTWKTCNPANGKCELKQNYCDTKNDCAENLICGSFEHKCQQQPEIITDFSDLTLTENSFWNGSDNSGYFISGSAKFTNNYNSEYQAWDGFAYSNMGDTTTPGWLNQYSVITGNGYENDIFALFFAGFNPNKIEFDTVDGYQIKGIYLTNTTYAYLSMKNGDDFAKKFGGNDGTDPDFFKIIIKGIKADNSETEESVEFYLADFRFEDNNEDYIVDKWTFVDLSSLGNIKGLTFSFDGSDKGNWGLNTPAYAAIGRIE